MVSWVRPRPRETQEAWYERASRDDQTIVFEIYEKATLRPIGNTELHSIDHCNGTAEFTIFIGAKDCWGKGYGTEATILTLDYAFSVLGLRNVMLIAYGFNERAIRTYARAGFKVIGRRRKALRQGDGLHDVIYMDAVAEELTSPHPDRLRPIVARHDLFWQGVDEAEAEYRNGQGRDYTDADALITDLGLRE